MTGWTKVPEDQSPRWAKSCVIGLFSHVYMGAGPPRGFWWPGATPNSGAPGLLAVCRCRLRYARGSQWRVEDLGEGGVATLFAREARADFY